MIPKVIALPDGEWAIASDGEWPDKGRSYWTGSAGEPWSSNMGKALVFESFRGANMELHKMSSSTANVIAPLIQAGHDDLADSLVNLVISRSLHIAVRDLPQELQKALTQVGYHGRDIEVIASDTYSMFGAGSKGRKEFTMAVNLKTGKTQLEEGSWGGENPFVHNPVDSDSQSRKLPPDFAVIKGSRGGGPTWARILVHPGNLASLLPSGEEDKLPKEELAALAIIDGIKGGNYRRDEFARYSELGEYGPNNPHIKSLLGKGLVKISSNGGITITTKGKNVNPGYQKLYSIMKAHVVLAAASLTTILDEVAEELEVRGEVELEREVSLVNEGLVIVASDDITNVFEGFYSQGKSSPKAIFDKELPKLRKSLDSIAKALDDELKAAYNPKYVFEPTGNFNDRMMQLFLNHIKNNYGMTPELARGIAAEIVKGARR